MSPTLVLTRSELRSCVDAPSFARELRQALKAEADGHARPQRVGAQLRPGMTAMALLPGTAPGVPAYTVKVHAKKNPRRRPALTGVICLHDLSSGDLLAILDSGWLTALRTGMGSAVGTDALARPDAGTVGVIGAGQQGRAQLEALTELRQPAAVQVFDVIPDAAHALAEHARGALELDARATPDLGRLAAGSDVLLVATWSRRPVVTARDVRPGTHLTSLGADEPGKVELDDALLEAALVVTDDRDLAANVLPRTDTTLRSVLRGEHPGRRSEDEITVYSPLGLPVQDCLIAWHAYQRARALGIGTELDLEGSDE